MNTLCSVNSDCADGLAKVHQFVDSKAAALTEGGIFLKKCETCGAPSKYSCPKCSMLSCSLACVTSHKTRTNCCGVRIKTEYVEKDNYTESTMMNDYYYLEEIGRFIENHQRAKRDYGSLNYLPKNLFRLQKAAQIRKTTLKILPPLFTRRKQSSTYLRYSDRKIFWSIEWKYPLSDVTAFDKQIDEEKLLGECLDKYLTPIQGEDQFENLLNYQGLGHKGVTVLIRDDRFAEKDNRFKVLNQNKSLKRNFKNKKIIEFPTLFVVPNIHLSSFL